MHVSCTINWNERVELVGFNVKWNQRALINLIAEYYTEIHNNENHGKKSLWKSFFHTYLKMKISSKQSKTMDNGEMNRYWLCL